MTERANTITTDSGCPGCGHSLGLHQRIDTGLCRCGWVGCECDYATRAAEREKLVAECDLARDECRRYNREWHRDTDTLPEIFALWDRAVAALQAYDSTHKETPDAD